ncbi:MAG: sigma 54-interacting transcriptional regulator [Alphaproteobacteria bacterium]|nr:sigma 54-interacting transcriptional regulator [Alphaproteobacteria bacterium]
MDETITSGSTEEDAARRDSVALIVAFHPDPAFLGRVVQIGNGSLTFGRDHPETELQLQLDRRMSRSHAEVIHLRDELVVRDLKSRNGTWVNGERIGHRPLRDGDVVRIGSMALVVRWMDRPTEGELPKSRLIGAGPGHLTTLRNIADFGPRDSVVLIEGQPGVGKGLVARALHEASGRAGPFVTFDCGAVAPGVMHSELFGHAAGAFSGARQRRGGLIELARGGTLFLDEIGDASPELQSSLLRLLEEGDYRPVGSDRPIRADVRVVAATNRDLDRAVREEKFRFDLLTRLRRLWMRVPSLEDRIEDVPMLATAFAQRHLSPEAVLHRQLAFALLEYHWPGNVRELDAVIERACVATDGNEVRWTDGLIPRSGRPPPDISRPPPIRPKSRPEPDELRQLLIAKDGNVTHLANDLGVARHTVYRWVKEAGIDLEALR